MPTANNDLPHNCLESGGRARIDLERGQGMRSFILPEFAVMIESISAQKELTTATGEACLAPAVTSKVKVVVLLTAGW